MNEKITKFLASLAADWNCCLDKLKWIKSSECEWSIAANKHISCMLDSTLGDAHELCNAMKLWNANIAVFNEVLATLEANEAQKKVKSQSRKFFCAHEKKIAKIFQKF